MIMTVSICVPGNDTTTCSSPSSPTGLAVGLTLFFLLLVIIAGVIVYKYHTKMRNTFQFGQRRSQKKEEYRETPQDDSHQYTSMITEQPTGQTPIYENLTTQTAGCNTPTLSESKFPSEPEEDVYLQCDSLDDAIYSNDPACNLSILPDSQEEEEDVYIVPDPL